MKKVQNIIIALIFGAIIQFAMMEGVFAEDIKVVVNNCPLSFDSPPITISDRTMVPMRKIFEALGATVNYDDATQTIVSSNGTTTVSMTIGNNTMWVNDNAVTLDVAPIIINDLTFIPVRAIAESYDCTVGWDEYTQTVTIVSGSKFYALKTYIMSNGTFDTENNKYYIYGKQEYNGSIMFNIYTYKLNDNEISLTIHFIPSGYPLDEYQTGKYPLEFILNLNPDQNPISLLVNNIDGGTTLFGYYDKTTQQFVELQSEHQTNDANEKQMLAELCMSFLQMLNQDLLLKTDNAISLGDLLYY